jgi:spore germination cell wall hydrolase CwlJ-like protein
VSYLKVLGDQSAGENKMEKSLKSLNLLFGLLFVIGLTIMISNNKIQSLRSNNYAKTESIESIEKNLSCLALNIYREAGHEPFEGKVAVAQVTLNRTQHPSFPNTVCEVVYQKNSFMGKVVCQFSWYCDSVHRMRPVNKQAYEESYRVAKMVYLEDFKLESVKSALYYHADYVNPNWGKKKVTKIGAHIFYE